LICLINLINQFIPKWVVVWKRLHVEKADQLPAQHLSEFMRFLASEALEEGDRLPPLAELSQQLGISTATLREQLEVARSMGLVEVRPRTGIRKKQYSFKPAVVQSLTYALASDAHCFEQYSDFRNQIEKIYWYPAVKLLTLADQAELQALIQRAFEKLDGHPIQIPHSEHRQLHLTIYSRLNNPFVNGVLEAFWEVYEAFGLNVYTDLNYQHKVWGYHKQMVDAICQENFEVGYQALTDHMNLIFQREPRLLAQRFE
jgi:DNA-binding FadR family transcriptional regulator